MLKFRYRGADRGIGELSEMTGMSRRLLYYRLVTLGMDVGAAIRHKARRGAGGQIIRLSAGDPWVRHAISCARSHTLGALRFIREGLEPCALADLQHLQDAVADLYRAVWAIEEGKK